MKFTRSWLPRWGAFAAGTAALLHRSADHQGASIAREPIIYIHVIHMGGHVVFNSALIAVGVGLDLKANAPPSSRKIFEHSAFAFRWKVGSANLRS